jgi:hypothetical protein
LTVIVLFNLKFPVQVTMLQATNFNVIFIQWTNLYLN